MNTMIEPKPPLTAYNLFFQIERKRILDGTDQNGTPITIPEIRMVSKEHKLKGKRPHRKTHGKISFRELARTVANRWKQLNQDTRGLLEDQAVVEKHAFEREYKKWLMRQENEENTPSGSQQNSGAMLGQFGSNANNDPADILQALQGLKDQIQAEIARLSCVGKTDTCFNQRTSLASPAPRYNVPTFSCGGGTKVVDANQRFQDQSMLAHYSLQQHHALRSMSLKEPRYNHVAPLCVGSRSPGAVPSNTHQEADLYRLGNLLAWSSGDQRAPMTSMQNSGSRGNCYPTAEPLPLTNTDEGGMSALLPEDWRNPTSGFDLYTALEAQEMDELFLE